MKKRDFKVIVNEENGIVMVVNTGIRDEVKAKVLKYNVPVTYNDLIKYVPDKVTGVAYCNPNDEFDELKGYTIAMYRYKNTVNNVISQLCAKVLKNTIHNINNCLVNLRYVNEGEYYDAIDGQNVHCDDCCVHCDDCCVDEGTIAIVNGNIIKLINI